jgi:DNA-binding CsgD family transcriptional regulator
MARKLERRQAELQRREREILEQTYLRRTNGFESVRDAMRRLGQVGSPSGILMRSAAELGVNSRFDRILISEVTDGRLTPRVLWSRNDEDAVLPNGFALSYPLIEHELAHQHALAAQLVLEITPRTPTQLLERFEWTSYVAGAIVADRGVIGLLHADTEYSGRVLDEIDKELIVFSCAGLGEVFERAALRAALQRHRRELQSAATWLSSRLHTTSRPGPPNPRDAAQDGGEVEVSALTAREREILALMAGGRTNGQIASALLIQEGTVKYHVKNVLRKLGARSRAEAVARFAQATGATPQ